MQAEVTTPRVYIASLSDYNAGHLRGEWFDLEDYTTSGDLMRAIYAMLKRFDKEFGLEYGQEREEWAAHDYEGFPERYYSEYMGFEAVLEYVHVISQWNPERVEALDLWLDNSSSNTVESFDDHYLGYYGGESAYDDEKTAATYAEEITDVSNVPAHIKNYIDWNSMGRDWTLSGDIWVSNGHVFNAN